MVNFDSNCVVFVFLVVQLQLGEATSDLAVTFLFLCITEYPGPSRYFISILSYHKSKCLRLAL